MCLMSSQLTYLYLAEIVLLFDIFFTAVSFLVS